MKSWKLAAVLAVVLLALGGLATWDEWKTKEEQAAEKTKNKLVDFKADDVVELGFKSKGTTEAEAGGEGEAKKPAAAPQPLDLVAVKKDGSWRLTKPVDTLADQGAVKNLIDTVSDYAYAKVVTDAKDKWAEYGLVDPERSITLKTGGEKPQEVTVFIGNKAPVGFSVYLRTSKDDKVYIGSQHIYTATAKPLFEFRDKTFVKVEEGKLKTLTYKAKGQEPIEMARAADGKWSITKPAALPADTDQVKDVVDELNMLHVASFEDAPAPAVTAALADPGYEISWTGDAGMTGDVKLAEAEGKLYGQVAGKVYGLPEDYKGKVKKDLTAFRDRRVLQVDSVDLSKVDIDGEAYVNVAGSWYKAADAAKLDDKGAPKDPKHKPAEAAHVRAFVVDLEFARTDKFIPLDDPVAKELGGAPQHRITLTSKDATKPALVLELFPAPGADDKYLVRKSGGDNLYRVAKSTFNSMTPSAAKPAGADKKDDEKSGEEEEGLNLDDLPEEPATEKPPTG